jgi:sugar-specific transcriptional regulator TrmB
LSEYLTYMTQDKLKETLIEFGLNEQEASIYLSSLSIGPTTIMKLANSSDIKRSTVYSIVESLKKKGLIRIDIKGFKKLFVAENPEKLGDVLERKKQNLQKTLPDLLALFNLKGKTGTIKYYEGIEIIKSVYESLIKDIRHGENYLIISDSKRWFELDKKYFLNFTERRALLPIKIRMLLIDNEEGRFLQKNQKNFNCSVKILPKGTELNTTLIVTPQRVVIHQLVEPLVAIVIENSSVIKMHQETFEIMWKSL